MRTFIRRILAAVAAIGAIAVSLPAHAQSQMSKDKLVGTWQLLSFKATTGDKAGYPLGERPGGYIGFTPNRFWVMVVDTTRKAPAGPSPTEAEALALMKSNAAYTGKYIVGPAQTPDGIKMTATVDAAANQALTGTNRVYFVRVDGNKLMLKSPSVFVPATGQMSVVELEFVKTD